MKKNKKGRYIVIKRNKLFNEDYISYNVEFKTKNNTILIAEFMCKEDAIKFKKLKNTELEQKGE